MPTKMAVSDAFRRFVVTETKSSASSGVVIITGVVLTCFHSLKVDSGIKVNGKEADIIAVDPLHDIALLQVETEECELVTLGEVDLGELVFSVGNPLNFPGALMFGHVCFQTDKRIVHDMHGAPGVSGSGLFNSRGELVGVNHSVAGNKHIGSWFTQAVPVLEMRNLLSKVFGIIQPTMEEVQKYGAPNEGVC